MIYFYLCLNIFGFVIQEYSSRKPLNEFDRFGAKQLLKEVKVNYDLIVRIVSSAYIVCNVAMAEAIMSIFLIY